MLGHRHWNMSGREIHHLQDVEVRSPGDKLPSLLSPSSGQLRRPYVPHGGIPWCWSSQFFIVELDSLLIRARHSHDRIMTFPCVQTLSSWFCILPYLIWLTDNISISKKQSFNSIIIVNMIIFKSSKFVF